MILSEKGLEDRKTWEEKGYRLPQYDRQAMVERTKANPLWVHFGAGNIFRAFQANIAQTLLNQGIMDRGIIVAEGFDYEIIEKEYGPKDNYSILVTLKSDGQIEKTVVGSIAESCILDSDKDRGFGRLKEIFAADSLQLATFTITEKGYSLTDGKGKLLSEVAKDYQAGPAKPVSYMGKVAALLYARYQNGQKPIAMVSNDNCSHNGDKLYAAMKEFAEKWVEAGKAEPGFLDYLSNKQKVSFQWTMIDKITPRPDESVKEILQKDGLEGLDSVITSKNSYVAPFVNAEETEYLVIEDAFPNGRPPLEKAGVIFTDKETVDKVEKMKVCTCLNPLHTALAIYGCMLGHTSIHDEMEDAELSALIEKMCYDEAMPVVVDPGVINPKNFAEAVLKKRLPNPFMPDTPQRIACDTSQKLPIRFGETIKFYQSREDLDPQNLTLIPLVLAGWCRYLMGLDDAGNTFEQSPDPRLDEVKVHVQGISFGDTDVHAALKPILSDATIFAVDLYEVGLGEKVEGMFVELIAGPGAIRATLKKYTKAHLA